MIKQSTTLKTVQAFASIGFIGILGTALASEQVSEKSSESAKEARAQDASDRLTKSERESQMPLPGQGYSHSSLLLDKAKDKQAVDRKLEELEEKGKIKK